MNGKHISIFLSVMAFAWVCIGAEDKVQKEETVVCKLLTLSNKSKLSAETIGAELQILAKQPLSKGAIEFSIALSNHGEKKIVFQADAFLDAMRISLKHKSDSSISLPENVRFRINAPVLPPRPYTISGWRIVTELPDGTTIAKELPNTILQCNDPKALRKEKIEIPALSTLIIDFKIVTLARTKQIQQRAEVEKVGIVEGEYTIGLSMLLSLHEDDSSKEFIRLGVENPVVLTVFQDTGTKHK